MVCLASCSSCGWETDGDARFCIKCGRPIKASGNCRACGATNTPDASYCMQCGTRLADGIASESPAMDFAVKNCRSCGRPIPVGGSDLCIDCVFDPSVEQQASMRKSPSGLLVAGGVLLVLAGILDMAHGALCLLATSVILDFGADPDFLPCCGFLFLVLGFAALCAGLLSFKQKDFMLVIVGAACGIIGLGFLVGAVFALLGLIFVAVSKEDFQR